MSVGLSIFLSVSLISIIYLFQKFPDSRKWIKILFLVIIILPLVALLFGYCYNLYTDYKNTKPQQITEYGQIKLAEVLENVRFMKGIPNKEYKFYISSLANFDLGKAEIMNNEGHFGTVPLQNLSKALQKYKISTKSKSRETFKAWEYRESYYGTKYFIRFTEKNTVGAISCTGNTLYSCPQIASVGINTTWDEVIKIFGSPPYGYTDFDDRKRAVCYPQYNLCFTLEKSEVQFITIKSWEAKDYYYLGKAIVERWNKDNYKYAIKAFDRAIKLDQVYTEAYIEKGWTLYLLEKYEEAINSYNYVTNLGYKSVDLYNKLGLALEKSSRTQEAMKAFDEALKLDPQYISAYTNKARLFAKEKEYEKAIVTLDKAIELTKKNGGSLLSFDLRNKGLYLSKLNKYEEAIEIYNESIAAESIPFNNCYAYHERGIALLALGRHKEAIESINKALELNPTNKKFQETLQAINLEKK